ncbi:MAG: phosphoglucosamine mutase [Candidatus Cloacimonas sp. 4484_209]|nr:MAG: phosphoglucosamine mutase [Candidatus Cloacimonas sp. 4484_209]
MKNNLMISVSGVRGIVGDGLTPDVISRFSMAFGTFLKKGRVIIGKDTRPSGEMVKHSVISGLVATGCEVIDLGVCPTPTVLYNVKNLHADGGIAITASHNPSEWNALKFVNNEGTFLTRSQAKKLLDIFNKGSFKTADWQNIGVLKTDSSGIKRHIDGVLRLSFLNIRKLRRRKFRVGVDCVNGAASSAFPELLEKLGCKIKKVYCDGNGKFLRNPEPIAKNLSALGKMVSKEGLDIGFATDADGDRLSIVGNDGTPLGEEHSLALAVSYFLSKKRGNVVINLSSSRMTDDIVKTHKVKVFRSKVGEANVVKKMKQTNAVIGGEGNGGIILPEFQMTRDGMSGIALILSYLLESGKTILQLKNELPSYYIIKEKKKLNSREHKLNYEKIIKLLPKGRINNNDGLRIDWKDCWIHIRKSGTEPIVRIIAEAKSKKEATLLCRKVKKIIDV